MKITKCDLCKRLMKKGEDEAHLYLPEFSTHDICMECMKKNCGKLLKKLKPRSKKA